MNDIASCIKQVEDNIVSACQKVSRSRGDVTLIAVSKTKPISMIMEAYNQGIRDFGENKVKELLTKKAQLPSDIRWHMIGHLQTNKVKSLIGSVQLIHSIDSLKLADCIDMEARKSGISIDGLLEVNVSNEESKFGFHMEDMMELLNRFAQYKYLHIKGLMTVAPYVDNPEDNRLIFRKLKQLSVDMNSKNIDNIDIKLLSMGMTGDYIVAVEEYANYIRVGTGIFGNREIEVI